jgi:mitochondrial import inner membrane translocase subunit TIM22
MRVAWGDSLHPFSWYWLVLSCFREASVCILPSNSVVNTIVFSSETYRLVRKISPSEKYLSCLTGIHLRARTDSVGYTVCRYGTRIAKSATMERPDSFSTSGENPPTSNASAEEHDNAENDSSSSRRKRPVSIYDTIMSQPELTSRHYSPEAALHRPVITSDASADPYSLDQITKRSLPYFLPWHMTAGPAQVPPDFSGLANSCGGKAAIGVFGGGVMGLLMGVFLGALSDSTVPVTYIAGKEVPQAPLREQMRSTLRATAAKSMYWCRNFAFITGVFGGSECLVEKYRGKHDVWNSVVSGCLTGAALQAKSGPQAAAVGCGGFAAFSLVIDSLMGHY